MTAAQRFRRLVGLILTFAVTAAAGWPASATRAVGISQDAAPYVRLDGSVYIVGSAGMREVLTRFNELFSQTHPNVRFTMLLDPTAATALGGLAAGVSAFAPMDRAAWPQETRPFRQVHGYEATDVRIGRNCYPAASRTRPPGVYVNTRNPLSGLTLEQVARVFTMGGGTGDLTRWEQLGLTGEWAQRLIHLYGPRDNGGYISALRHSRMDGRPFSRRYEPLASDAAIIQAVADDPYGVGLVGLHEVAVLPPTVRLLPLAENANEPYRVADDETLHAGRYPLAEFLHLYIDKIPGKSPDPLVADYIRLVLSPEGQEIITATGHVPLTPAEAEHERSKLGQFR
ncbi:MAG: hypothetical protein PHQ04_09460 [Opitutaceae bacterium]|nr:hypothetical protein [Opitutaceae bacterium]